MRGMGKRCDIDKAIANLMKWAERSEWSEERAAVLDDHLARISRRLNKSLEELGAELAGPPAGKRPLLSRQQHVPDVLHTGRRISIGRLRNKLTTGSPLPPRAEIVIAPNSLAR